MKPRTVVCVLMGVFALAVYAQQPATSGVPRLIKFSGAIAGAQGTVGVTFALYKDQSGGAPLWQETQSVTVDTNGRYAIYLGANHADGIPADLFSSGETRWLGVQPEGQAEQARILLASVPYALTAGDAQTLGGRPLSAFVLAGNSTATGTDGLNYVNTTAVKNASAGLVTPLVTSGTAGYLGMFVDSSSLGNSAAYQSGSSIGINTTNPQAALHVVSSSTPAGIVDVYSNTLNAVTFVTRAARGTPASPAAVQAGDIIGGFTGRGWGTTGFSGGRGALIIHANEAWSDAAQSTYIQFNTTALGTAYQTERMRIDNAGNVGIGTTAPDSTLTVAGPIHSTSGGFKFPDGTTQTTAGAVITGSNTLTGNQTVNGNVVFNYPGGPTGVGFEVHADADPDSCAGLAATLHHPEAVSWCAAVSGITGDGRLGAYFESVGGTAIYGVGSGSNYPAAKFDNTTGGPILSLQNNFREVISADGSGLLTLRPQGTATSSTNYSSGSLSLEASNWVGGAPQTQMFRLRTAPAGTTDLLSFDYGTGNTTTPTGLSISANGNINFAPGQSFPTANVGTLTSTGNLGIPATTGPGAGVLMAGGYSFLHAFGGVTNAFIGTNAGGAFANTGMGNTGTGYLSLNSVTSGQYNSAAGYTSLRYLTTGSNNSAFGAGSMYNNVSGYGNSAFGFNSLAGNVSGTGNTAVGYASLYASTGNANTAVGDSALAATTTGTGNNALGFHALWKNTTGAGNNGFGYYALSSNTVGQYNTAFGDTSLPSNVDGNNNTALGHNAGYNNAGGSNNLFLGYNSGPDGTHTATILTNAIAIGANAAVNQNNTLVLGGTGANAVQVGIGTSTPTTALQVAGTVTATSFSGSGSGLTTVPTSALSGTLPIGNGGTSATSASAARSNLGAAASGANSDITSLSSLSTALSVSQGGTGATTAAGAVTNLGAVDLASTQTIVGAKTFSSALNVSSISATGNVTASGYLQVGPSSHKAKIDTNGMLIMGTGSSGSPSGGGSGFTAIIVRRLESADQTNGTLVAIADQSLSLQRDGTLGGLKAVTDGFAGNYSLTCMGMNSSGTSVNVYHEFVTSEGTFQVYPNSSNIVRYDCRIGYPYGGGHDTMVSMHRKANDYDWVGTLISDTNQ